MARGNERRTVFARDVDRQLWLSTLAEMVEGFAVVVTRFRSTGGIRTSSSVFMGSCHVASVKCPENGARPGGCDMGCVHARLFSGHDLHIA